MTSIMQWRVGEHCSQTFIFKKHPSRYPSEIEKMEVETVEKVGVEVKCELEGGRLRPESTRELSPGKEI